MTSLKGEVGHTPGPWRYSEVWRPPLGNRPTAAGERVDAHGNVFYGYSISGSSERGASILPTLGAVHNFPGQTLANARLIAAAPDLLAALKIMTRHYDVGDSFGNEVLATAFAAIAKASALTSLKD